VIEDHLIRNGSFLGKNYFGKFIALGIVTIILISACSAGGMTSLGANSVDAPQNGLPSSARIMGEVPKSVQPTNEPSQVRGATALQAPAVGGGSSVAKAAAGLPQDAPLSVQEQPQAPLAEVDVQPMAQEIQPAPEVDLSLPSGPQVGLRAPVFTLQTLEGDPLGLSDLLGHPVVISYWATWCVPCQNELGILTRIFPEYQARGLQVITINAIEQDNVDKIHNAVDELGMKFPVLLDEGGQFSQMYQAVFFPTTIYVDASGVIRHIALGDSSEPEFRSKIELLLTGGL
jgi:peroxiredoxin